MTTEYPGRCPVCEHDTMFEMQAPKYYRSAKCASCGSWPAQRAFWYALTSLRTNWRDLTIHESSPGGDPVTFRFLKECRNYVVSQYNPEQPGGMMVFDQGKAGGKYIVQDLQKQTFPDNYFDLVVTREVFEHVFDPESAISEIARTLKPGGLCLMAVPVANRFKATQRRARIVDGVVEHILPPEYHGNPMSKDGALVTIDWGYDIAPLLTKFSGIPFYSQTFDNLDLGIRDEFNQILVGFKGSLPDIS
ncbi:MAG: class I SAM-dependent methyltransferase [Alphaproteobacteria bacterium]|nr:class I SAM-dependent methyltransferase [Alphaproteobacteria bacterium]